MNQTSVWRPRPLLGAWTPDQCRIAAHFPGARRLCVTSANGVGKTHLAADLAVSCLLDLPGAVLITTAPTRRQVRELLWPQINNRLIAAGLRDGDDSARVGWAGCVPGHNGCVARAIGFATNTPQRMQGYHAENLLVIVDEASGMTGLLLNAIEGIAVGETNYVLAIGNPNEPLGPFYELSRRPSWDQECISALTHPNILERREVIPGATTYIALCDRLRDWCRESDEPIPGETFEFEGKHYVPNDEFRVRYLGVFPRAASDQLIGPELVEAAVDRAISTGGRRIAALDIARLGGDDTVYGLRCGDCVTRVHLVPPGDLMEQAEYVGRLLREDNPESITCDAAGLGIGLIDRLRQLQVPGTEVRAFLGSDPPISPLAQKRYDNRRAQAYGNLAGAFRGQTISIPKDAELLEDLARVTYSHNSAGQLVITPKERTKAETGRSPDRGDMLSMLWEQEGEGAWSDGLRPRDREEEAEW